MPSLNSGRFTLASAAALAVTLAVGCSSGPKIPTTTPVTGKVIYNDKPLAGAEVGFITGGDNKQVLPARGVTNDAGEFKLSTYIDAQNEVTGATPGEFTVVITKVETMDPEKMREEFANNPTMQLKQLVPAKYTSATETPLKAKVEAGKPNSFEFKLED